MEKSEVKSIRRTYNITGMSCAACSARVEKAVGKVDGVTQVAVNLLTNSMGVSGDVEPDRIIEAVEAAGYGASLKQVGADNTPAGENHEKSLEDRETPLLKKRLVASVFFLLILMYFSMGHMMWNWPVPAFFEDNHVAMGLLQMLLTMVIMVINQKFFVSGFKSFIHGAPNMDTLVALGSGAAFVYSTYALFGMTDAVLLNDSDRVMDYMHDFYFESSAMILSLITVGKMLEARSKGKTTDAIRGLLSLAPETAVVIRQEKEMEIPIKQVNTGDIFVVKPGKNIPVDGVVVEGESAVNEAALTGESIPVDKQVGDSVWAATLNQSGYLKCQATRVGEDTTLSQIVRMVTEASATKAPIAKIADKVSGIFVPAVIFFAVVTFICWRIAGETTGFALARGISVLVISCPCALGLATPVAIMVGSGLGARNGIMFKTAVSLEETGKTKIVVLDKTGTITKGEPEVTDIIPGEGYSRKEVLSLAAALEKKSEHPLARAVMEKAKEENLATEEVEKFQAVPGNGLSAIRMTGDKEKLTGGNLEFIRQQISSLPEGIKEKALAMAEQGKTPLYFTKGDTFLGIIGVSDTIKKDSEQAVLRLKQMGIRVIMLTGDNEGTALAVGAKAGVDEVIAGVLPEGKEQVIRKLKKEGKVAMVGDGINDAPALTSADMGIAIGAGSDIAIDAADVVLMKSTLADVPAAIALSRATLRNIHQNLFWAFIYNVIGIFLASGVFIPLLHWELNPMFAAAAMSLSSFCVVTNALRLNFCRLYDTTKDKKIKHVTKERKEKTMEKTMKIEGMMCGHCEAAVKKCLEELEAVTEAVVSHETGTAIVKLSGEIDEDVLKKAVEEKDYKVLSIE